MLTAAGNRSADVYLSAAAKRFKLDGGTFTDAMKVEMMELKSWSQACGNSED